METVAHTRPGFVLSRWHGSLAVFVIGVIALLVLFWPTAVSMERIWRGSDTFQHTYIIPFVLAYLVWEYRGRLADIQPQVSWLGVAAMFIGSLGWLAGHVAGVQLVMQLALVGMIQAFILAVFGWKVLWAMFFPIAFMIFLVPMGEFMVPILQQWTADFSVWSLELMGLPITTDGLFIYVDGGNTDYSRFHVAKECSGIRYLTAMFQVGLLAAALFFKSWPRRITAVLMAIAIPIVANWLRALGIILLVYYTEGEYGVGLDHIIYGFWFFLFVLLVYLGACWFFADPLDPEDAPRPLPRQPLGMAGLTGLLVLATGAMAAASAGPLYAAYTHPAVYADTSQVTAPPAPRGWRTSEYSGIDWRPVFQNADGEVNQRYSNGPDMVDLYIGTYTHQRQGGELINSSNSLAGDLWEPRTTGRFELIIDGQTLNVPVARILRAGPQGWGPNAVRERAVAYWYWIDGRLVTDPRQAKLLAATARLTGGEQASAVIAVATDYKGDLASAQPVIQTFIDQVKPMQAVEGLKTP